LVLRSLPPPHAFYKSMYLEVIAVLHYNQHDDVVHCICLKNLCFIKVNVFAPSCVYSLLPPCMYPRLPSYICVNVYKLPQKRIISQWSPIPWKIVYFICFVVRISLMRLVGCQQLTCLCVKMEFVFGMISLSCELYSFSWSCFRSRGSGTIVYGK